MSTEKTGKLIVNLAEVERMLAYRKLINSTPLSDIEWQRDGVPVTVSDEDMERWRYTGLSNIDFSRVAWIEPECFRAFEFSTRAAAE